MRLLHVISTLDPASGGPPMVATRLAAAQVGLGHEVGILTYATPSAEAAIEESLQSLPHGPGVVRHTLPPASRIERVLARGARRHLDELVPGVDYVHVHSIWQPISPAAAAVAHRHGVPYAVTPHGMLDPWSLQQRRLKKKVALALAYKRMLTRASFLHLLNADEKRLIEPLGITCAKEVIPNGVFLEELQPLPAPDRFRSCCPELGDHPFVLFLSRLHYKKGLDYLAEAFAEIAPELGDLHLVVAGPDQGASASFERRIADAGLGPRTHLVGPLYGEAKLAALADATCFCLPSRQEGFSVAIVEALACRVPVVISDQCHFPEVAEAGAGEVVALEHHAVAAALRRIVADPDLRKRMGAAGRRLVEDRFTWTRIAELSLEVYARHPGRRVSAPGN